MPTPLSSNTSLKIVVPDFSIKGDYSTPIKSDNIVKTSNQVFSILPTKKTSQLVFSLLTLFLFATVPLIIYIIAHIPSSNQPLQIALAWCIGFIFTLTPLTAYFVVQLGNKIDISTKDGIFRYRSAMGSSVDFYYRAPSEGFNIAYFSNTTAQGRFTKKGWAGFYQGRHMLFRLNMERWDVEDLWWMAENLPAKIIVINERTGFKYVEKLFPGYFPMFASSPIMSSALLFIGSLILVVSEFILWSAAIHFFSF